MGTPLHSRSRRVTARPSRSGRPRSRMTTSGGWSVAWVSASAPRAASSTRQPWPCSVVRRKARIGSSSSTTSASGAWPAGGGSSGSGPRRPLGCAGHGGRVLAGGQAHAEERAAAGAPLGLDRAAVRQRDAAADREAEAGAQRALARATPELVEQARQVLLAQARAAIGHLQHQLAAALAALEA